MRTLILPVALALAALSGAPAAAADILQQQCVACHAVKKPEKPGLDHLWQRKAPDLHYAGLKFQREWLVAWLQNPTPIRPAGVMPAAAARAQAGAPDSIDPAALAPHPRLAKEQAVAAADALMALAPAGLVTPGAFKNEPVNASFGAMLFSKLRGCTSCHSGKPGSGGQSAPELYSAGARLQADYVIAYLQDPHKFDPQVWMPRLDLNPGDLQKLTGYLLSLKPQEKTP